MKLAFGLLVVTFVGIMIGQTIGRRAFPVALLIGALGASLVGLAIGGTEVIYMTGEGALNGAFGSKNSFAYVACLLLLSSVSVVTSRRVSFALRVTAIFGAFLALDLLTQTRSTGAMIAGGVGLAVLGGLSGFYALPARHRSTMSVFALVVVSGAVIVLVAVLLDRGAVLASLGKSSDLTGRGELWTAADELIARRPWLGVGYQAFWLQDNPWAEALWATQHIEARMGFHFHNLYYETTVELGRIGLAIFSLTFFLIAGRAVRSMQQSPGSATFFFCALLALLFSRMFAEVDFLFPFTLGTLLLPAIAAANRATYDTSAVFPEPLVRQDSLTV